MPDPFHGSWYEMLTEDFDSDDGCLDRVRAEIAATGVLREGVCWEPSFDNNLRDYEHVEIGTSSGAEFTPAPPAPWPTAAERAADKEARRRQRIRENALAKRGVSVSEEDRERTMLQFKLEALARAS